MACSLWCMGVPVDPFGLATRLPGTGFDDPVCPVRFLGLYLSIANNVLGAVQVINVKTIPVPKRLQVKVLHQHAALQSSMCQLLRISVEGRGSCCRSLSTSRRAEFSGPPAPKVLPCGSNAGVIAEEAS